LSLVGFWINPRQAGEPLGVTLYWTARGPIETDEAISVQLLNAAGGLVAQQDGEPANGGAPTTTWPAGRIIQDTHQVALPDKFAPGDYQLILVVYDRSSLVRLMTTDGGPQQDHVDLGIVRIP